jgi:hypothetical protein
MSGREGHKHVETIAATYRPQRNRRPARFPLDAVDRSAGFDGRLA